MLKMEDFIQSVFSGPIQIVSITFDIRILQIIRKHNSSQQQQQQQQQQQTNLGEILFLIDCLIHPDFVTEALEGGESRSSIDTIWISWSR